MLFSLKMSQVHTYFIPKRMVGLCLHYIVARFRNESERNCRSCREAGVNLPRYDKFRYNILWWLYAKEVRATRGNRSDLWQYCTFLGLVETLTAADSPSWPSWKTSTTQTLEVGLKLRSLIRNSTQGACRYASQESLNSMYWRQKKNHSHQCNLVIQGSWLTFNCLSFPCFYRSGVVLNLTFCHSRQGRARLQTVSHERIPLYLGARDACNAIELSKDNYLLSCNWSERSSCYWDL